MHNVNGVELTDAQFEEYNKLSTPAEKADYLERHKQLANTASQESKEAAIDASIDQKSKGDWWTKNKVDKNSRYTKVNGKWLSEEQLAHWTSLSDVRAQNDYLDSIEDNITDAEAERLNKKNPDTSEYENKANGRGVGTITENTEPMTKEEKKALEEADKVQMKEDKKYNKDMEDFGVYVNNASGKTDESKLPEILTLSSIDFQSNDKYKVADVFKAAKKIGWQPKQVKEYLDNLYGEGKWSDLAKAEWEKSGYGALETNKKTEVETKIENAPTTTTTETETPPPTTTTTTTGTGSGTGTTPPPAGDDGTTPPPTEDVEVEPVATKEEAKTQSENIDAAITELEEQLANAPDEVTRQELEIRLKNAKHAKELYDSMLVLTDEEIAKRYSSRTGMDDFVKRQRAGGLSGYYKREKSRLKDQLEAAKEAGDDAKVKKLENELKELSGEKGYFIADSIETALRNLSSTYAGQAPSATSEWSKKQGDILKAETDRWNEHWNEQMQGIDADFTQKYEEDDARRQAWNDIKNNEAAQMAAKRLGLLDDTFNAEAAINLQKLFGSMSTADALITMAQMNDYGVEDMAAFVLGRAAKNGNLNLEEVVGNLGTIVKNLGDAAGDLSGSLSDLIEYLTSNGEKHGLKFWEYGK